MGNPRLVRWLCSPCTGVMLCMLCCLCTAFSQDAGDAPANSPHPLSGSSLAPARPVAAKYGAAEEAVLDGIEARAPAGGEFQVRVDWEVTSETWLDWGRDGMGLGSYKTGLDWHTPPAEGQTVRSAQLRLSGQGADVRISRLDAEGTEVEWWSKTGEYLYSSRLGELLPFLTRWHAIEFLESGALAYGEGLGLVLWAMQPGEFLRRAPHLEAAEAVRVNGKVYQPLVAPPDWVVNPPTVLGRTYYPYNHSTLIDWGGLSPQITYFVDTVTGRIDGAVLEYFKVLRSHRGIWTAVPEPSGARLESWVEQWQETPQGLAIPARIEAVYAVGDAIVRRTALSVRHETAAPPFTPYTPEPGRRPYEPWPPYQSAVYQGRIDAGRVDYASRVGLVNALAFEGDLAAALGAFKALLDDLVSDSELLPESTAGIDWHLGLALYEMLQQPASPECAALWTDFAPREPFIGILGRAVDFYARWHLAQDAARVEEYFQLYEQRFGATARLLHALERRLTEHVESETHRGMELEGIFARTVDEPIRLRAAQAAVEAYLRDGNLEAALGAIGNARAALLDPENVATFEGWAAQWEMRIAKVVEERELRERAALIRAKESMLAQLLARLQAAPAEGRVTRRLEAIVGRLEADLRDLGN